MFTRSSAVLVVAVALVAACQAADPTTSVAPASPAAVASPTPNATPTATASPPPILAGRIVFLRSGADEVEHYFTIDPDGGNETSLFDREACGCASWSADGSRVQTVDATGLGTWSLLTMKPDGSDSVVIEPPDQDAQPLRRGLQRRRSRDLVLGDGRKGAGEQRPVSRLAGSRHTQARECAA